MSFQRQLLCTSLVLVFSRPFSAASDLQNSDPSQWTGQDVFKILHDSPWTKTVKVSGSGGGSSSLGGSSSTPNAPAAAPAGQMPGRMGRRGMGGQRTYSSGSGSGNSGGNSKSQPEQVSIQWQSSIPVQLAIAKHDGQPATIGSVAEQSEYVIAVIGLPLADFGGRAASADSDSTTDEQVAQRVQDELKKCTQLIRPHQNPLSPTKIELDQGKDGRTLFHFSKQDPIMLKDKAVEFQIVNGQAKIRSSFTLKEMTYQGRLEL